MKKYCCLGVKFLGSCDSTCEGDCCISEAEARWLACDGTKCYCHEPSICPDCGCTHGEGDGAAVSIRAARFVAEHWRDSYMQNLRGDPNVPWGIGTHPLALVLAALDGETDPRELGLPESADEQFAASLAGETVSASSSAYTEPNEGADDAP